MSRGHRSGHRHPDNESWFGVDNPLVERLITLVLLVVLALTIWSVATPDTAAAHTISANDCRAYGRARAVVLRPDRPSAGARRRAVRACKRAARLHLLTHGLPLPPLLNMIRACESGRRDGNGRGIPGTFYYLAANPSSTASGAYQYLDSTWGGHMGYRRAKDAPRRIQDGRALRDFYAGAYQQLWDASRSCWG